MSSICKFAETVLQVGRVNVCMCRVLSDHYYKAYQSGERISDYDLELWAQWANSFFDLDMAMEHRERVAALPKGKTKPKRKFRAPVSVRTVRAASYHQLKALDKMCNDHLGEGLYQLSVPEF